MSIGDERGSASIEAAGPVTGRSSRRKRHSLIAPYPGVEQSTMAPAPAALGRSRTAALIIVSACCLWALIFGVARLLH